MPIVNKNLKFIALALFVVVLFATGKSAYANVLPGCYQVVSSNNTQNVVEKICPLGAPYSTAVADNKCYVDQNATLFSAFQLAVETSCTSLTPAVIKPPGCYFVSAGRAIRVPDATCLDGTKVAGFTGDPTANCYLLAGDPTKAQTSAKAVSCAGSDLITPQLLQGSDKNFRAKYKDPALGCNPDNNNECSLLNYVKLAINILSATVAVVVVLVIVVAGIQYSMSGDQPDKLQGAKVRIRNALFALLAFIFLYAFLQYIVPGGMVQL